MARRTQAPWLPRILFRLSFLIAGALTLVVLLAPWCDKLQARGRIRTNWLSLFARDIALRRTAIASAIGLGVTASIFYKPQFRSRTAPPRQPPAGPPTSENVVGA
jgi:hypothetical protein